MDSPESIMVRRIEQIDPHTLGIEWSDGRKSRWRLSHLRRNCPCASCIDEWTGAAKLRPDEVSDDIQATGIDSVGRYALAIKFTDGHSSGIYSFDVLRRLDQAPFAPSAS